MFILNLVIIGTKRINEKCFHIFLLLVWLDQCKQKRSSHLSLSKIYHFTTNDDLYERKTALTWQKGLFFNGPANKKYSAIINLIYLSCTCLFILFEVL